MKKFIGLTVEENVHDTFSIFAKIKKDSMSKIIENAMIDYITKNKAEINENILNENILNPELTKNIEKR